jgi:asparagine synthase (glutamine-hydrolysing)
MCGIAGVLNFGAEGVDADLLQRMIRIVRHRGPDSHAVYADGPVGLAHARLSIIDLAGGRQPMSNGGGSVWITFNGEIFNYIELREDLVRRGYRFATQSDTEVILHAYEEYGENCVRFFNGQWAFAIWDVREQKLFLSRDRLGVRPLFYTLAGRCLVFGSEVKSIFVHPNVRRVLDRRGLDELFTFWTTIPPATVFEDVRELPPGHSITVKDGKVEVRPYWRLDYPRSQEAIKDEGEYSERLLALLVDATQIRLRSDVPVGAYLSGGLDSSVVTALIKKFTDSPLKTFSVTFDDPEFDESIYQREVSDYLKTDHHEVRCSYDDISRVFPEVIWHTEKPVLRTAPAPLYLLSGLVRQHGYKVVITGEGSDEMLGGYDIFKEAKIRRFWGRRPESRLRPLLLKRLYPYLPSLQAQSDAYLKEFFHIRVQDRSSPFFSHLPRWELTSRLKLFFSEDVKAQIRDHDAYAELERQLPLAYGAWDDLCQAQYLETSYLLPGYILSSQGDRVAMGHSVEGRFPFLDHRIVEFATRIPSRLKLRVLNEKFILKQSAGHLIPASIAKRPKQPYRAPEVKSFFGDGAPRHEYVAELLSPERIRRDGVFNPAAVGKLVEKARNGRVQGIKDNMALVGILSTQLVIDQFINHFEPREGDAPH